MKNQLLVTPSLYTKIFNNTVRAFQRQTDVGLGVLTDFGDHGGFREEYIWPVDCVVLRPLPSVGVAVALQTMTCNMYEKFDQFPASKFY